MWPVLSTAKIKSIFYPVDVLSINSYYVKTAGRQLPVSMCNQIKHCHFADDPLFFSPYRWKRTSTLSVLSVFHFYKYQIFSISNDQVNFSAFAAKILCYNKKALFFQKGSRLFFMAAAMVIAFVVSMYSIQFLLGYVKKHDFKFFGYYRIVLGVIVLIYFGLTSILAK